MFVRGVNLISLYAIPFILLVVIAYGVCKKVRVYEVFTEGAKEGFNTAVRIIPFLTAMLVAIGVFRASGAMGYFAKLVSPLTNLIGMPAEALPMALMRPLSGGGADGIMNELFKVHGPDSFIGRLVSVMAGSTDTTFYVLAVYFGAVGIKKSRHALPAGLIADLCGILAALAVCRLVFAS
ncbi:spore maturation protein [Jonquetella anthropi]|uniref:spore maturation protein n=1 Tax=Jonquetella anthropi TaxID=428712 RepID=UPI0023F17660|nr:spore maturation protein [Jonquetella anthropi]